MGKWFKDKKSAGCAMCKPWKHGHSIKFKEKELALRKRIDKMLRELKQGELAERRLHLP